MGFWEPLFFWIFALGAVITSLAVVVVRNPLYCALALVLDFLFFAGLYVLLSAHFLAVVQVLVYGGAIMVLFLFIIMLLNLRDEELGKNRFQLHYIVAVLGGIGLFFFAGAAILTLSEVNEEAVSGPVVESAIPGLYLQLDEESLEEKYQAQLSTWEQGSSRPSDGKYRLFDSEREFELPPSLRSAPSDAAALPGREGVYGTFKPVSVLLVNRFVVPFELTAILLLVAIIGAVIIAKRRVS